MDDQRLVLSKYPVPLNFHKCDNAHWKGKGGSRAVTVVKKMGVQHQQMLFSLTGLVLNTISDCCKIYEVYLQ